VRIPFQIPPREAKPFDVVGFGENSVDLLAVVAEFPARNTKQPLQRVARLPGGQIATALVACARLGWRARYLGTFGCDDLGTLSRSSLVDAGVDVTGAATVEGATNRFAVILVDARTGDRTVLWDRHPALTLEPGDVSRDAVTSGRLLLVDAQDVAASARAAKFARDAGIPTVADVDKVRPGIGELLEHVDAIIASEDFPTALTGHEQIGHAIAALAREFDAALVCVTLGSEGSLAWCQGREVRTPAFPVDCVDSTGAGDLFRAGFAAACLRAEVPDLEAALGYANAVAALNCRALGARGGIPSPDDVERLMRSRTAPL